MPQTNPFFHRGPVREPAHFFGRAREVKFITDLLRQGQSVSVSGSRRLGKTSLLMHLAHPDVAAAHDLSPSLIRWVYLDGGALDGVTEEQVYGLIDQALGGEAEAVPYMRFTEQLRRLAEHTPSPRLILALDEFELIACNPALGPAFFNHLRGLAAQFPIQFITASKDPILQLTFAHADTLSSPFFNIFAPLALTLFSEAEALELLTTLSTRGGCAFQPDTLAFILEFAGPHPLFLQVAGYRAFAEVGPAGGLSDSARHSIYQQALADLEPHLQYYWSNLDAEAHYTLAALPLLHEESRSPIIERLEGAGLIRGWAYLGQALENFIRLQQVEGLLQAGPFLVDLRSGQVAVDGEPTYLTRTEFSALKLFLEHPGELLSLEAIEMGLWPGEATTDFERVRGIVKKLRRALGPAGEAIVNRRGRGYLFSLDKTPF